MSESLIKVFNHDNVPSHALVNFIWNCDPTTLQSVSPRTLTYRPYIKAPLVLIVGLTGAFSGLVMSLMKCSTELIATEGGVSVLPAALFFSAIGVAVLEMFTMNLAMQYYD